jgi:uncharacterized protein YggE
MKIKIIRATIAQKQQVYPGQVLDVSKDEAVQIIGAGKAVAVPDVSVPSVSVETTVKAAGEVESTVLPRGKTRGGKKKEE